MAHYVTISTVTDGSTYTMPFDGYLLIGANGAEVTVSITIDGVVFDFDTTIANGKVKGLDNRFPQGAVFTITGSASKVMAYNL